MKHSKVITVILVLNFVVGSIFVTNAAIAAVTSRGDFLTDSGTRIAAAAATYDFNTSVSSKMPDGDSWYRTQAGLWYYFENDRTTTKRGWYDDPRDGQRYYLDLNTGIMLVGWQIIDGNEYYFNESHNNEVNWYDTGNGWYESYGKQVKAYGSMFRNERTPDGKRVDESGKLVDNSSKKDFDSKLVREYNNNIGRAKFDQDGNLWILSSNEILGGPGERITIKYANNKSEIYEKSGYSSAYEDGGHVDEYLTIINGVQREESVNEYKGEIQGPVAQKVNQIFNQYYSMKDSYK